MRCFWNVVFAENLWDWVEREQPDGDEDLLAFRFNAWQGVHQATEDGDLRCHYRTVEKEISEFWACRRCGRGLFVYLPPEEWARRKGELEKAAKRWRRPWYTSAEVMPVGAPVGSFWAHKHGPDLDGNWVCAYKKDHHPGNQKRLARWTRLAQENSMEVCRWCGRPMAGTEGTKDWEKEEDLQAGEPIDIPKETAHHKPKHKVEREPSESRLPPEEWWDE